MTQSHPRLTFRNPSIDLRVSLACPRDILSKPLPFPCFPEGEATAPIAGYQFARMTRNVSVKETSKSWRRKVLDA